MRTRGGGLRKMRLFLSLLVGRNLRKGVIRRDPQGHTPWREVCLQWRQWAGWGGGGGDAKKGEVFFLYLLFFGGIGQKKSGFWKLRAQLGFSWETDGWETL